VYNKIQQKGKTSGIYASALDLVIGEEIARTRPVVTVSNHKDSEFSGTVSVLPYTPNSLHNQYPFAVYSGKGKDNLPKNSVYLTQFPEKVL